MLLKQDDLYKRDPSPYISLLSPCIYHIPFNNNTKQQQQQLKLAVADWPLFLY